jgi:hypothetical protein
MGTLGWLLVRHKPRRALETAVPVVPVVPVCDCGDFELDEKHKD